ncbi:uncharacterized protein LOC143292125 [Babylonia areolata]|uniref:uncharacterized protein LOC143292125 n=1 Tax=Babylonia areolata TaxID=304850 RepID=UPI003FD3105F
MATFFIYSVYVLLCLFGLAPSLYAKTGGRLSCVQCTPADPRCESGSLEASLCQETDKYCATYYVFIGTSQGIFRGCSQRRFRFRGCRQIVIDNQELVICFMTCSWDGCNAGYGTKAYLL